MSKTVLETSKVEVKGVTKFGPFTVAEVTYAANGGKIIYGTGIAKQGKEDRFKDEIGRNIAISRAQKAIVNKLHGKRVNIAFAG